VQKVEVWQSDQEQLNAKVAFWDSEPKYASLTHNSVTTVWTPASGNRIHLISLAASTDGSGSLEIRRDDTTFLRLEFGERKAIPFSLATEVKLNPDEVIKVLWTGDTGNEKAYITLFGHEH